MSFNNTNYLYLDFYTQNTVVTKISELEITSSVAFCSIYSISSKTNTEGQQKGSFEKFFEQYLQLVHNKDPPFVYLSL